MTDEPSCKVSITMVYETTRMPLVALESDIECEFHEEIQPYFMKVGEPYYWLLSHEENDADAICEPCFSRLCQLVGETP